MRLKTYTAPTIAQAMEMIRRDLGEDAVIVSTQGERGHHGARVTAAVDGDAAWPSAPSPALHGKARDAERPPGSPDALPPSSDRRLARRLAYHGLAAPLVRHLVEEAAAYAGEGDAIALSAALDGLLSFHPICERRQRRPLLLVGTPGAGKTMTAAKLIVRARRAGRRVVALSADGERAGGLEQLEPLLRLLGLPLTAVSAPEDLAAALAAGGRRTGTDDALAVVDTPGGSFFDAGQLAHLRDLAAAADAEPVLVMAAGGDASESIDIAEAALALGCRRLVVTRVDGVRRLGALVTVAEATGLALADVGISPQVSDGLMPLNPVSLARLLLPETMDEATR